MFTGIIEHTGIVEEIIKDGSNLRFLIRSPLSSGLKADQSVSHNGACLTIEEIKSGSHYITAVAETLSKTNLGKLAPGDIVNLERCMPMNGRIDGHIVQGHIDTTGTCTGIKEMDGSWQYSFEFPPQFGHLIIEKGSICVNGISLTAFEVKRNSFTVAVIPYTYYHTNIKNLLLANEINLEFDIIGKYLARFKELI